MPKISVIIPVYRVEKTIERCARSLFEQTMDDIEYVFVDDGSPDNSIQVLKGVISNYPDRRNKTKILVHETNKGLPFARKTGIDAATGDYVAFCDSDDMVDIHMYQAMYTAALEDGSDLVVCDINIYEEGRIAAVDKGACTTNMEQFQRDLLYQNVSWAMWNKLFRKELLNNVRYYPVYNMGEDMVLTMQIIHSCKKMSYLPFPYSYYCLNQDSIVGNHTTKSTLNKFKQYLGNYYRLESFYRDNGELRKYRNELTWIRYSVKNILLVRDKKCRTLRRKTFPLIGIKVLLCCNLSKKYFVEVIRNIGREFIY